MSFTVVRQLTAWKRAVSIAAGTTSLVLAGMVYGQTPAPMGAPPVNSRYYGHTTPFQQTGFNLQQEVDSGYTAPPAAPAMESPLMPQACPAPEPAPAGPWTLTDIFDDGCGNNCFKSDNIKLYGNMAQSMTFNFQSPRDKFNGPVTWTDRSNEYQLNQLWFGMEKATDASKGGMDWGFRVDANYGTNSRLATESGFEGNINGSNAFYGWAFPNAYAELATGKLKVKMGRFVSPIGYFTVNTVDNFFNTIPYTYQWGEPFTHTGIWGTYQVSDNLVVSTGIIRGWDNFDNSNPHVGYLGTWGYTFQDKSNLTQVTIWSREPNFNFDFTSRYYQSLVYMKPINDKWNYVGQSDLGVQQDATASGKTAFWYGLNQYLYYVVNEKLTMGFNFEWWRDEEGYRVAGFLPSDLPSGITSPARGFPTNRLGYEGNFYQVTMGPKWYPTESKNFFIRPNLRFDWFQGDINANLNPAGLKPYDDGGKNYQSLFVTDVVLLF